MFADFVFGSLDGNPEGAARRGAVQSKKQIRKSEKPEASLAPWQPDVVTIGISLKSAEIFTEFCRNFGKFQINFSSFVF